MSFTVLIAPDAAREIQAARVWLFDHRGADRADAFEAELAHALDLLETCPEMGPPALKDERRVLLRKCRYLLYYRAYREAETIVVTRIRHEKRRPLKR